MILIQLNENIPESQSVEFVSFALFLFNRLVKGSYAIVVSYNSEI